MTGAVFLDRDGVLNRDSDDFIRTPEEIEILPGVPEAVKRLNNSGLVTVVITNQSGIARGFFTESALGQMHAKLIPLVESAGGKIAGVYYCPHGPKEGCDCRKPRPGMLQQAAQDLGIDLNASFFVGDRPEDIACGHAVGARTVLVLTGKTKVYVSSRFPCAPDFIARTIGDAAEWIISRQKAG